MNEWQKLYLGNFQETTEREKLIDNLATEYHRLCDAYDNLICTGKSPYTNELIPATSEQAAAINRNAREVLKMLLEERGHEQGVTRAELFRAIQTHWRNKR